MQRRVAKEDPDAQVVLAPGARHMRIAGTSVFPVVVMLCVRMERWTRPTSTVQESDCLCDVSEWSDRKGSERIAKTSVELLVR